MLSFLSVFLSIVVPTALYAFLPKWVSFLTKKRLTRDTILLAACVVYFLSWYLPSPLIYGEDTAFTTHFVGGGLFSGLLWLFLKKQMGWKFSPLMEWISLYALVSALGVVNELFEFTIVETNLVHNLNGADTWWDLVANTSGAMLFWLVYRMTMAFSAKNH